MPRPPATLLVLPLVLLANVAGGQTLREKRFGPSAPGDTLPKVVTREFELYGPTAEEVRLANDEIKVAISQFGQSLGEQPKKMAFVLFRNAAEAGRYETKPLTRRGMQIVPWVLPPSASGGSAAVAPPPGTPGSGAQPDPLGHEAGHQFLIAYVENALAEAARQSGSATGTANGGAAGGTSSTAQGIAIPPPHPDIAVLPDWLEEAVAALCERPSLQKRRIDFMRASLDRRIPFTELLTMRRPGAPAAGKTAKTGGASAAPKEGSAGGPRSADADRAALFCNESLSLARFIAQREEDRFIGTIIEGVLRGRTVNDVLNTSQNINSKPEALEKQWLEWLQGAGRAP